MRRRRGRREDEDQEECKQERVMKKTWKETRMKTKRWNDVEECHPRDHSSQRACRPQPNRLLLLFWALGMVSSCGAVFLKYFRKTDIAKNVVLRGELVSFPYGAKAVYRSSAVFLKYFRKTTKSQYLSKTFQKDNDFRTHNLPNL